MLHRLPAAALGLAAVLLCPRPAAAQELSLEEALALARQRAPAILEATGRISEAEGRVAGASPLLRENPTLEVEAGPRTSADGSRDTQLAVGLSQPLELGGKRGRRLEAARAALTGATARSQDAQRQVLESVAEAFLRTLHARERLRLTQAAEAASRDILQSVQRRFDTGDVPVIDVNVARVAHTRARVDVADAEAEEAALRAELRVLLGLSEDAPFGVRGALGALATADVTPPSPAPERPDIAALAAELEEARAEQRLGQSARWPDLAVGARYEDEGDESVVLGTLALSLPVFARGQEARVSGAARVRRLEGALEAARRAARVQVEAARLRYDKRRSALELLEREALPLLEENEALALKSYSAGELELAGFLLVRREVLEARAAHLDTLLRTALARVHLAVQIGALR